MGSDESAFAGVRKTVDATEEEFDQLNQTLKDMKTPTTFEELAHIMELGGQLGVANENLAEFTETIDKLAVSTNLTSEDAATLAAQFANITKMDMSDIDRWGSTIVKL
jgi:TP901 family phage tail tape measure protein